MPKVTNLDHGEKKGVQHRYTRVLSVVQTVTLTSFGLLCALNLRDIMNQLITRATDYHPEYKLLLTFGAFLITLLVTAMLTVAWED